jgi:four helix bundle protein
MTNDGGKKLFRFLDWEVYKDAQGVFIEVVQIVRKLPQDLRYTLGSQIMRSGLSVILNIAEGSGRVTDKEMSRFFDISLGSINETMAGLDCLLKLDCLDEGTFQRVFQKYESISRQLGGFKKKLTNNH